MRDATVPFMELEDADERTIGQGSRENMMGAAMNRRSSRSAIWVCVSQEVV